jgi:DNA-binding response OmpR family regulator
MAEVLSLNLESAGLEVEVIRDGISALARLDDSPPDAVVLDLGLPEVSGYRVMRVLRNTAGWENTPVVVATAYNFEEAADVIRDGVDEFMTKPFDMDDLVRRVISVIGAKRRSGTEGSTGG